MTRANSSPIATAMADGWQTMAEQEQDQELLPAISPSTPPSSTSTRQPATVDGRAPVDGPPSARPPEDIRSDLRTASSSPLHRTSAGVYEGSPQSAYAIVRLLDDVEPLLAEVEAAHRFEQATDAEREALLAEKAALEARIGSALSWIERHDSKWGSLTIELDSIRDSLLGIACVDATPGATSSARFAAGVATQPEKEQPR